MRGSASTTASPQVGAAIFEDPKRSGVFHLCRYDDIALLFDNDAAIDPAPYDKALVEMFGRAGFILSADKQASNIAKQLLIGALKRQFGGATAMDTAPLLDHVAKITKHQANRVIDCLIATYGKGQPINLLQEYGVNTLYLVIQNLFGLRLPRRPPFILKILWFFRNLYARSQGAVAIDYRDTMASAATFRMLSLVVFGQLFGALGDNRLAKWASRAAARQLVSYVRASHPAEGEASSNIAHALFAEAEAQKVAPDAAQMVLIELSGTVMVVAGMAFSQIVALMAEPDGVTDMPDWSALADSLHLARTEGQRQRLFNELLRLADNQTRIRRRTLQPITFGTFTVPAGSEIVAHLGLSHRDASHFAEPNRFMLSRADNAFVHGAGAHVCMGQAIARVMLKELLHTAATRLTPDERTQGKVTTFAKMPDAAQWILRPPPKSLAMGPRLSALIAEISNIERDDQPVPSDAMPVGPDESAALDAKPEPLLPESE